LTVIASQADDRWLLSPLGWVPSDTRALGAIIEGAEAWEVNVSMALKQGYWEAAEEDAEALIDEVTEYHVAPVGLYLFAGQTPPPEAI